MPDRNQNLIGKQFGHLTVIAKSDKRGNEGEYLWICQCDCGRKVLESTGLLNSGEVTSCGHVRLEKSKHNLRFTQDRHLKQLNNRPPKHNTSGYRNISIGIHNGKRAYRVTVMYNKHQHTKWRQTLEDALQAREELRERWWPGYKAGDNDERL